MEYRIVRSILFVVPGREIDHFQAETIIRYTEAAAQAAVLPAVGF